MNFSGELEEKNWNCEPRIGVSELAVDEHWEPEKDRIRTSMSESLITLGIRLAESRTTYAEPHDLDGRS